MKPALTYFVNNHKLGGYIQEDVSFIDQLLADGIWTLNSNIGLTYKYYLKDISTNIKHYIGLDSYLGIRSRFNGQYVEDEYYFSVACGPVWGLEYWLTKYIKFETSAFLIFGTNGVLPHVERVYTPFTIQYGLKGPSIGFIYKF